MAFVKGFGRFWYDFIVGDDWKIAAAVVVALTLGAVLVVNETLADSWLVIVGAIAVAVAFVASLVIDVRTH